MPAIFIPILPHSGSESEHFRAIFPIRAAERLQAGMDRPKTGDPRHSAVRAAYVTCDERLSSLTSAITVASDARAAFHSRARIRLHDRIGLPRALRKVSPGLREHSQSLRNLPQSARDLSRSLRRVSQRGREHSRTVRNLPPPLREHSQTRRDDSPTWRIGPKDR